jgi:glycine/D-amino acid oxidase-like deaminating enzyme
LLPDLEHLLRTSAIAVTYWHDTSGECSAARGFPILYNARLTDIYALPSCEYPDLVKILYHGGPDANADARDVPDRRPFVDKVSAYVRRHMPGLAHHEPAIQETCMYTHTPDNEPVLDRIHLARGIPAEEIRPGPICCSVAPTLSDSRSGAGVCRRDHPECAVRVGSAVVLL